MKGQDLEALEQFKAMTPPTGLPKGSEVEMTIRGDSFLYKSATGGMGTIRSEVFNRAMCDVYYGSDCVSASHKKAVVDGIPKL